MPTKAEEFWESELTRFLADPAAALEKALEYVCCPVCAVLVDLCFNYFAHLPTRWADEPSLRAVVTASGGFCNHHSWQLSRMQSNVAIARVFVDVTAGLAGRTSRATEPCPLCFLEDLAAERLLSHLSERLADEEEREYFRRRFGLCYPHWYDLLAMTLPPEVREFAVQWQREYTSHLSTDLQGFLDKDTVELRPTRTTTENRSARHAILKTAGNDGI